MRKPLIFVMFFLAVSSSASAAPVKMVGFDDMTCGAWKASKGDPEQRRMFVAWVRGVLTGHNYARQSQQVSAVSNSTVENFVDRYCTEMPQGDFGEAALRMTDRFSGRNEAIAK
ncbi:HdeA/HdeB family chaperone [Propionivibrio limicola]|uniref:HdeA/HdeB family chaperone n=1 Tax=Propionivibrio limicola TaxID=167645 RepID=UPI001FE67D88|nr:HdeA/HdeB family chaperone [Propionivibrio limicola]